jgi:hypothetical protein
MVTATALIPDPTTAKPPSPRRWIPLSLRMFLAMLGFLSIVGVLWTGIPAYRQYLAILELKQIGGKVYRTRPVGPAWLRKRVGYKFTDAFDEIEAIGFLPLEATFWERRSSGAYSGPLPWTKGSVEVNDSSLTCIRAFPKLKELDLSYTNVSDGGVEHIAALQYLEWLDVTGTDISDVSVRLLRKLAKLKQLRIEETRMSEEGVAELQRALPQTMIEQ